MFARKTTLETPVQGNGVVPRLASPPKELYSTVMSWIRLPASAQARLTTWGVPPRLAPKTLLTSVSPLVPYDFGNGFVQVSKPLQFQKRLRWTVPWLPPPIVKQSRWKPDPAGIE